MKDTELHSAHRGRIQWIIPCKPEWLDENGFLTNAPSFYEILHDPRLERYGTEWAEHGAPTQFVGSYMKTTKQRQVNTTKILGQSVFSFRISPGLIEQELSTNVVATIANGSIRVGRKDIGTVIEIWEQVFKGPHSRERQWRRAAVQTLVDLPSDKDNCPVKLHTFLNRFFAEAEKVFNAVGIDRRDTDPAAPANTWLFKMIKNVNRTRGSGEFDTSVLWKNEQTPDWLREQWEIAIPCFEEAKEYENRMDYPHPEHFSSREAWQEQIRGSIKQWFEVMDTYRRERQQQCAKIATLSLGDRSTEGN